MIQTYRPSGSFNSSVFPLAVAAIGATAAVGVGYQFAVDWIPFIYLNALLSVGLGFFGSLAAAYCITSSKTRNIALGALVGVVVGFGGVASSHYTAYTKWNSAVSEAISAQLEEEGQQVPETGQQIPIADYLAFRSSQGWSIGRSSSSSAPITGWLFFATWLIEAGIIVGITTYAALNAARAAFCERCDRWADEKRVVRHYAVEDSTHIEGLKGATQLSDILKPAPESVNSSTSITYTLHNCPGCRQGGFLSVVRMDTKTNKKGEQETKEKELWKNVILSATDADGLSKEATRKEPAAETEMHQSAPA